MTSWRADLDFDGQISRYEFEVALRQEELFGHKGDGLSDEWIQEFWDWMVSDKDDKEKTSFAQIRSKLDSYA